MSHLKPRALGVLLWDLKHANAQLDRDENEAARTSFLEIQDKARKLGIHSAFLSWKLAVAFDCLGDPEMAMRHVNEALALDPLALPFHSSFATIAERVRNSLTAEGVDVSLPWVPKFYALIAGLNEADERCHLVMVRHLVRAERLPEARRLLDALLVLHPAFGEAWSELATLAKRMGDDVVAAHAVVEAAAATGQSSALDVRFMQGVKAC